MATKSTPKQAELSPTEEKPKQAELSPTEEKPKQAELSPTEEKPKPIAATYYALSNGKEWQVWQVDVYNGEDGKPRTEQAPVYSHGSLVVARQRLMVLLDRVLP